MPMFEVKYKSSVQKDFRKINKNERIKIIDTIEKILTTNPFIGAELKGKYKYLRKYRIGNYRIIYSIEEKELYILVIRVGHRKDVYENII